MKKSILAVSALVLFTTGCSSISKSDFDALRADVTASKEASDKAYAAAQQANVNATDAKEMSIKTNERLNRVFRKAQMK